MRPATLLLAARAALLAERLALASWRGASLGAAAIGVCLALDAPPAWAALALPLLLWDLRALRLPSQAEAARFAEAPARHRPLSTLGDPRAGGEESLWPQAVAAKEAAVRALPLPRPRPVLATADPWGLRFVAALLLLLGVALALVRGGGFLRGPNAAPPSAPAAHLAESAEGADARGAGRQDVGPPRGKSLDSASPGGSQAPRGGGKGQGGEPGEQDRGRSRPGQSGDRRAAERGEPDATRKGPNPVPAEHADERRLWQEGPERGPPRYDPLGRPLGPERAQRQDRPADARAVPTPEQRLNQALEARLRARAADPDLPEAERAYYARLLGE